MKKFLMFLCMVSIMSFSVSAFAISVDGNVTGFTEGYTSGYNVLFDIEKGPSGVPGGSLFTAEDMNTMYFGLILPLNIVDNTYGINKASDWTRDHKLDELEGSDKWEFKYDVDNKEVELKLDYIEKQDGDYNARIERFKYDGSNLDLSMIAFATSLHYNYHTLNLTQFFDKDSPGPPPSGTPVAYEFDSPAENWVPEIMYEFSIDKNAFPSGWFDIGSSVLHISPNKLGDKKVYPTLGNQINAVPEPSTMLLLASGLAGLVAFRRKFRKS